VTALRVPEPAKASAYGTPAFPRISEVPSLPYGLTSPEEMQGSWYVVPCHSQYERKLALLLTLLAPGIGYCLPMERVTTPKKKYTRLVCPSVIFVCCRHDDDCYELTNREGVGNPVRARDQVDFVKDLVAFHRAAEQGVLKAKLKAIHAGIECEIVRGPMKGCRGWVEKVQDERKDGSQDVVIKMTVLGDYRSTTVSIEDVEPV
jgi:transcription antitermination factor NusG